MNNMRIGTRILASFALALALVGAAGIVNHFQSQEVKRQVTLITTNTMPSVELAGRFAAQVNRLRALHFQHVASTDDASMAQIEVALQASRAEVRKLAERSQAAAREIDAVAAGSVQTAERSSGILGELVGSIQRTASLVHEIAAASREQAASVGQMSKATAIIDQVTQRNAAAAEELARTAEGLSEQSRRTAQLVSFFKVDGAANDDGAVVHAQVVPLRAPRPRASMLPAPRAKKAVGDEHFVAC